MRAMRHIRGTHSMLLLLSASLLGAQTTSPQPTRSTDAPDATIMAPITALARYMARVEGNVPPPVFVDDGLVIVEDFAPYVFSGKDAASQWDAGFRHHAIPLRDLKFGFGPAHDFERTGDLVFLVLPTTWRGFYKDRHFEEHGAWTFVLKNVAGQWRILAYGWGQLTCRTGLPKHSRSRAKFRGGICQVLINALELTNRGNFRVVASLDRKRLGTISSSNPKCHAEAFPIKASDNLSPINLMESGSGKYFSERSL